MKSDYIVARLADEIEILEVPMITKDLNQISEWLPSGAYTTFRTYDHFKALDLYGHFRRLEETVMLAGKHIQISQFDIRLGIRTLLDDYKNDEARVRITIDLTRNLGDVYVALGPLIIPSHEEYQRGVKIITCNIGRRENPKAKLTDFIPVAERVRAKLGAGVHEALIVNGGGQILEGLSSNFFAVMNGQIWVAEEGALSGLTMKMVLAEADRLGIPYQTRGITVSELERIDEAFITSASRSILPVTNIDGNIVGNGQVGQITSRLMIAFQENLAENLTTI